MPHLKNDFILIKFTKIKMKNELFLIKGLHLLMDFRNFLQI